MKFRNSRSVRFSVLVSIPLLTVCLSVTGCTKKTAEESTGLIDAAHVMDGAWKFSQCDTINQSLSDGNSYLSFQNLYLIDGENHYHSGLYYQSSDCTGTPALSVDGAQIINSLESLKTVQTPHFRKIISPAGAPDGFYVMVDYWEEDSQITFGKGWYMAIQGEQSTFYFGHYLPCFDHQTCSVNDDWNDFVSTSEDSSALQTFLDNPFDGLSQHAIRFTGELVQDSGASE